MKDEKRKEKGEPRLVYATSQAEWRDHETHATRQETLKQKTIVHGTTIPEWEKSGEKPKEGKKKSSERND